MACSSFTFIGINYVHKVLFDLCEGSERDIYVILLTFKINKNKIPYHDEVFAFVQTFSSFPFRYK